MACDGAFQLPFQLPFKLPFQLPFPLFFKASDSPSHTLPRTPPSVRVPACESGHARANGGGADEASSPVADGWAGEEL